MCDKRDRAITCVFCRDLHLTTMFSGPLPKDLFEGMWRLRKVVSNKIVTLVKQDLKSSFLSRPVA